MKKALKFLPLLVIAVLGLTFTSCSDDDEKPFPFTDLPAQAQAFIAYNFPSESVLNAYIEDDGDYEVTLSNGTTIEFSPSGQWQSVSAALGQTVPQGFYPAAIDEYLSLNLPGSGINEISIELSGNYEVELVNGTDILFGPDGSFLGYDF